MCKTAIIMTEAEAMALPQSKRPLCFRIPSAIYTAVWEYVGAASMCWEPRPGNQVFAAEEASNVAVNLCFKIADELERLGVTTEMMRDAAPQPPPPKSKLETAEAEIARLENITVIQQKQIERLMQERDTVFLAKQPETIPTGLRCKTCNDLSTIRIEAIGMNFCQACLDKIDAHLKSIS